MVLIFLDVSSYYCGTGGCWIFFFEKRDGQWQVFNQAFAFDIYPTDEKILGYRTFYVFSGYRYRWDGTRYQVDCPKRRPRDLPPAFPRHCSE